MPRHVDVAWIHEVGSLHKSHLWNLTFENCMWTACELTYFVVFLLSVLKVLLLEKIDFV